LRHILVEAPNPEALKEAYWLSDRAADRKYYIRRLLVEPDGELHIFIDANYARVTAGIEALFSLSKQAVKMLAANGILQPSEPPLAPSDTREAQPHEKFYDLRQWMLFIHRHAKDRPGAPPGVESAPYLDLEHFKLRKGGIAHTLGCSVFEASALILGRLLDEVTRGACQAPTAGPARTPSGGADRTAAQPEAAAEQQAPLPSGTAAPSDPTEGDRPPPTAAGSGGEPQGDRQGAGSDASGSKALPSSGAKQKRPRGPRRISKVQTAIVILKYRAKKERESVRVEDIAEEAKCSAQNLYKSPEFRGALKAVRARRIRCGWKTEGVADCPDDST
jgi:hypothetical protein